MPGLRVKTISYLGLKLSGVCCIRRAGIQVHEHADPPHPLGLLARAASGHAVALPSSVMNSRRFT
jgi:hypothetical protein